MLKPIFVILTSLSIIWDFQVFNQVWVMLNSEPTQDYYLMSIYSFVESFQISQYGLGAAIAVVMVGRCSPSRFVYMRQMVKLGEVRVSAHAAAGELRSPEAPAPITSRHLLGILVFAVMVFPVYWMVATAFKPGADILATRRKWFPFPPTLANFSDAINRPYFWAIVKNSLIIVGAVVALSLVRRAPGRPRAREVPLLRPQGVHRDRSSPSR